MPARSVRKSPFRVISEPSIVRGGAVNAQLPNSQALPGLETGPTSTRWCSAGALDVAESYGSARTLQIISVVE